LDWIGLGQDFQATLWIGLDWIHELMDWIGSAKMDPCPTLSCTTLSIQQNILCKCIMQTYYRDH